MTVLALRSILALVIAAFVLLGAAAAGAHDAGTAAPGTADIAAPADHGAGRLAALVPLSLDHGGACDGATPVPGGVCCAPGLAGCICGTLGLGQARGDLAFAAALPALAAGAPLTAIFADRPIPPPRGLV